MSSELYDVVVVEQETSKVHKIIGEKMRAKDAERRVMTGVSRYDTDRVFIADVPAGKFKVGDVFQNE